MIDVARPLLAMGFLLSGAAIPAQTAEPSMVPAGTAACASLIRALEKSGDASSPVTIVQAREYLRRGDETSCRLALQRIDLGSAPSAMAPATPQPSVASEQPTVSNPPARPPIRDVSVSQLRPLAVWNDKERLGDIRRIAAGPQNTRYVLIAAGGFLGIGEKLVALQIDSLRHNGDRLISTMTEAEIRALPDVANDAAYRDLDETQTIAMRP